MTNFPSGWDLRQRAGEYASRQKHFTLGNRLGLGTDGLIIATNRYSAIKIFERENGYLNERDAYLRLQEHNVHSILGHKVPQLLAFDDHLRIIEMSIVTPPFILDFAKSDLDYTTSFPDHVMEEWRQQKIEEFEHHWPKVVLILGELENRYGIYMKDVHPRNICFADPD
jgi:hypothetical protein